MSRSTFTLSGNGASLAFGRRPSVDSVILTDGISGLDDNQMTAELAAFSGVPGGVIASTAQPPRTVSLPLVVSGRDRAGWEATRALLRRICSPYGGLTRLEVTSVTGGTRSIEGRAVDPDARQWSRPGFLPDRGRQALTVTLLCEDPFFRSPVVERVWETGAGVAFFGTGWPHYLRRSRIVGETSDAGVGGDAPCWPTWIIQGPATRVIARHVASGRSWTLTAPLLLGQTVTVETDPRRGGLAVIGPDGSSYFRFLAAPFDLWGLGPLDQRVSVELQGATNDSRVTLRAQPTWRGAL